MPTVKRTRLVSLLVASSVVASMVSLTWSPGPAAARVRPALPSDFNGDGYADLAVGAPGEDVGDKAAAGAINVIYGSATGLSAAGNQHFSQASRGVKGKAEGCPDRRCDDPGDRFGAALASGDFNRDGYADLAIGVPYDRAATIRLAGAVNVLYGSRKGLTASGDQRWSQGNLPGEPGVPDRFGEALAAADFDGDGYADLAIGAPADDAVPWQYGAGTVTILRGSDAGLSSNGVRVLRREDVGVASLPGQAFGIALAAGDIDADGLADLAVGMPDQHCDTSPPYCYNSGGEVDVFYGDPAGPGASRAERWTQDSPGVVDDAEPDDFLGAGLAFGDFNADGYADLAAGASGEKATDCGASCLGQGAVTVLHGSADGLTGVGSELWQLDTPGIPGVAEPGSHLGRVLAAGDLDGDGAEELIIGSFGATVKETENAGMVVVIRGSPGGGLTATGAQRFTQGTADVPGSVGFQHGFGFSLAVANLGRSARSDVAIGVPGARVHRVKRAGSVIILFGTSSGLSAKHAQRWSQGSPSIRGRPEAWDQFGWSFAR